MTRFRDGSIDQDVWRSVVQDNEYGLPPTLAPSARIVDIGVHIGSFVRACWDRGARNITGYEVDGENFELARHNVGQLDGVKLFNIAVDRSDDKFSGAVRFGGYTPRDNGGVNTGSGDIFGDAADPVAPATRFDDVVGGTAGAAPPCIDLLKLDCEGAEWPILYTSRALDRIGAIVGEYHGMPRNLEAALGLGRPCTPAALRSFLIEVGFVDVEIGAPEGVHHGAYQCGRFRAARARGGW